MKKHNIADWRAMFDSLHGEGASAEFERLLIDQSTTFKAIGERFGVSTQRVSQLVERYFPAYNRRTIGTIQMRRAAERRAQQRGQT